MGLVIGVDVGSQSVKAALVDPQGEAHANSSVAYDTRYPASGWAEQDPGQWERAVAHAVRQLRTAAGIGRSEVTMLALACQLDGLVALDDDRRPLRPAIVWLDHRATAQSARLAASAGESTLFARTGLNADASHMAPKAMWMRDVEPDRYDAARWLSSVSGHLNGWLTGEVVHDHGNASSTLLYDLSRGGWSDELAAHAGLTVEQLPAIRGSREVLGPLRPAAAEALGLTTACSVAVGTGDDQAAVLGAGAVKQDTVVDVTGTAEAVAAPSVHALLDEQRLLETHAHAVKDMLLVENPGFVSGGSTRWWAQISGMPQAEVFAQAALAAPGSSGALFLQSRLWLQIKADVTRLAVRAIQAKSAASSGAAMLAAVAAGWFDNLPEAAGQTVELAAVPVLPDAANAAVYSEAYAGYRRLFDGVEGAL